MCAAPGSKTAQIIEMVHANEQHQVVPCKKSCLFCFVDFMELGHISSHEQPIHGTLHFFSRLPQWKRWIMDITDMHWNTGNFCLETNSWIDPCQRCRLQTQSYVDPPDQASSEPLLDGHQPRRLDDAFVEAGPQQVRRGCSL